MCHNLKWSSQEEDCTNRYQMCATLMFFSFLWSLEWGWPARFQDGPCTGCWLEASVPVHMRLSRGMLHRVADFLQSKAIQEGENDQEARRLCAVQSPRSHSVTSALFYSLEVQNIRKWVDES